MSYVWIRRAILISAIIYVIAISVHSLDYPVVPFGQCYEGTRLMESYYHEQGLPTQIAYSGYISDQYPGHVWLKVGSGPDFEIYDSYYGKITTEGEHGFPKWYAPD